MLGSTDGAVTFAVHHSEESQMKRFFSIPILAIALVATLARAAEPVVIDVPTNIQPIGGSGLTRAEVIANYHISQLAGLPDLTRGELGIDANSYAYRKAFATYVSLRESPQYAELVNELQRNPGLSVVAGRRANPVAASK